LNPEPARIENHGYNELEELYCERFEFQINSKNTFGKITQWKGKLRLWQM
jgi:hypothetical protein